MVIGLDFGNFKSFTCFISDLDDNTRLGGNVHDLLPQGLNDGIPSVFFYSERTGVICGEGALRARAKPVKNRIRYLKRHLDENIVIDGETISYNSAITEVVQHCVRKANEQLKSGWQMTTNLISLSYPATYTFAQLQRLIGLVQNATLIDGTKVEVVGTIKEPAAAALDYLAEDTHRIEDTIVLVYDLGGGTFDLALVAAYPEGKSNGSVGLSYYDIIDTGGVPEVGGAEFDEIMFNLILSKFNEFNDVSLSNAHNDLIRNLSETTKVALSSDSDAEAELLYNDEYLSVNITREEFEEASRKLLMKTIEATRKMLNDHPNQQPEYILLTGGASQMPMVRKELEMALPHYKGKIIFFRPNRAIAYGAARYGTREENPDIQTVDSVVLQRVDRDLGVRFYKSLDDEKGYISTYIPAGTPIPYAGIYNESSSLAEKTRYSKFSVYQANKPNPNEENVTEDYQEIMFVTLDHETEVPKGTRHETRLVINELGVLTIEAREVDKPEKPPIKNTIELKNLS